MEPLAYVMAILGCGDGALACEPVRTVPAVYLTMLDCEAAAAPALAESADLSYPVLTAECRRATPLMAVAATKPRG